MKNEKMKQKESLVLNKLLTTLAEIPELHAPGTPIYSLIKSIARNEMEYLFSKNNDVFNLGHFGELKFPYVSMGSVDSLNLFDIDELILFSFYYKNKEKYTKCVDIGANIGLHSILLSKSGYQIKAYEPDPTHFKILKKNITLNDCRNLELIQAAVSSEEGTQNFIRIIGNTTGSCLEGAKKHFYGDLEKFSVRTVSIKNLMNWADILKIDAEGSEKDILLATSREDWINTDALVEVGTEENATAIYEHFKKLKINMFSQKKNWLVVERINDMPTHYSEGTLYISSKKNMPW